MPFTLNLDTFSIDDSTIHVTQLCEFVVCARCAWKQADLSCCSWNILPSACKILTHYPVLCSLHKTSHPYLWSQAAIGFHTTNPPVANIFLPRSKHEARAVLPNIRENPNPFASKRIHPSIHALRLQPNIHIAFSFQVHNPGTSVARLGATISGMTTFYQKTMWVSGWDYKCAKTLQKT